MGIAVIAHVSPFKASCNKLRLDLCIIESMPEVPIHDVRSLQAALRIAFFVSMKRSCVAFGQRADEGSQA